jgi:4-amino-4-deoxy-L-arabinose transferase-like glycosyltransferase
MKNLMQRQWLIAVCLLLISILARFPYYFVDVISWDESTFILMGQSLLDGHLPYTELWDIKPPLAFVAFAFFIMVLGKSIIAIRIAGTLCVFLTSWFVYVIGRELGDYPSGMLRDRSVGILAGIVTIFSMSLIRSGQSTMTEHLACVLLIGGLAWLITRTMTPGVLFLGGLLLTGATLVRLNLAYVVIGVGIWLLFSKFKHQKVSWGGIFAYCLGSFSLIFLTYLPYLITGDGTIWFNSVVLAPLSYSDSVEQMGTGKKILGACLIFVTLSQLWQRTSSKKQQEFSLLQTLLFATVISILRGGEFHQHYYIQLAPLLALTVALFWGRLPSPRGRLILVGLVAAILLAIAQPIFSQYQLIGDRLMTGKPLPYGNSYEIIKYLQQHNPEQQPVYLMKNHLVYWLTDLKPLSKAATHPSNVGKDYLFQYIEGAQSSAEGEMRKILAKKPKFIIKQENSSHVEEHPAANLLFQQILTTDYRLVKKIDDREIYQIR